MNHLYIDHPGSQIGVRQNQLVVRKTDGQELCYPLNQVQRITLTTQAHFSGAAINALFQQGITATFCSGSGYLRGHLQPGSLQHGQVQRRAAQYALIPQTQTKIPLAAGLVVAKIRNQQRVLADWGLAHANSMAYFAEHAARADSLDSLRGYEGQAAKHYFSGLAAKLGHTPFVFTGRQRPATDPANALLSFGYALLQSEFAVAIDQYGMDRFAGLFHASSGSQPALVLDLMEPFRPLVDRLAVRLLGNHFHPDDFVEKNGQCRLRDGCRGHYIREWERLLQQVKLWQGEQSSYRLLIARQTCQWARYLDNPEAIPHWWRLGG